MEIGKNTKAYDTHKNNMDMVVANFLACLKEKDPVKKAAMMKAADEKMKGLSEESQKRGFYFKTRETFVEKDMREAAAKEMAEKNLPPDYYWKPEEHGNRSFWD